MKNLHGSQYDFVTQIQCQNCSIVCLPILGWILGHSNTHTLKTKAVSPCLFGQWTSSQNDIGIVHYLRNRYRGYIDRALTLNINVVVAPLVWRAPL